MLNRRIDEIKSAFLKEADNSQDEKSLYDTKVKYVGRNGELTQILKNLKNLSPEERKQIGPLANEARQEIEKAYDARKKELGEQIDWEKEKIDVTLPGKKAEIGSLHPITIVYREIEKIFSSMGFEIVEGPELETDWYNFTALNFPLDHPARDMQDTFWVKSEKEKHVLRTHTSPVQVRYMEKHKPPFRIIVPGRVFRNEATDAAHEHTLHQFEALVVGDDINVGHFKYIASQFFSAFFGKKVGIRLRPSFFPFTEPSFEFDISCTVCGGKKCPSCKNSGWLEIGGAGMVNQNVLVAAGIPETAIRVLPGDSELSALL
jgi:phenylalanyl-tRNA synthetase alpha chain